MQSLQTPLAIIIAGALVAGAVVFSGGQAGSAPDTAAENFGNNNSAGATNVLPVDPDVDHILGPLDAKVTIIEYSDFECPFCARFHPTVESVVEDFGGEVAWVYRHFPLSNIHSEATGAAVASECVAELGGNTAFWEYADELFKNQRGLSADLYRTLAVQLGVDASAFDECIDSGRHEDRVARDFNNARATGGNGTPHTIIVTKKNEVFPFSGALSYSQVRGIVEQALATQ